MKGFIFLLRKIIEWRWFKFPHHLQMFIYLLEMANWKDTQFGKIELKRGQLITSQRTIREDLGCSFETINKVLKDLVETGEITKESLSKGTLITIPNYNEFQDLSYLLSVSPAEALTEALGRAKAEALTEAESETLIEAEGRAKAEAQTEHKPSTNRSHTNNIKNIKKEKNLKKEEEEKNSSSSSTTTQSKNDFFKKIKSENVAEYLKSQNDMWRENMMVSLHIGKNDSLLDRLINSFQQELISAGAVEKEENDLRRHFLSYARKALKNDDAFKTAKVERMADATAYGIADKDYNDNWN